MRVAGLAGGEVTRHSRTSQIQDCQVTIEGENGSRKIVVKAGNPYGMRWPHIGLVGKNSLEQYSRIHPMGGGVPGVLQRNHGEVLVPPECGIEINSFAPAVVSLDVVDDGYTASKEKMREDTLWVARSIASSVGCSLDGFRDPQGNVPSMQVGDAVDGEICGIDKLNLMRSGVLSSSVNVRESVVGSRTDSWSCLLEVDGADRREKSMAVVTVSSLPEVTSKFERDFKQDYLESGSVGRALLSCDSSKTLVSMEYARTDDHEDSSVIWKDHLVELPEALERVTEAIAHELDCETSSTRD